MGLNASRKKIRERLVGDTSPAQVDDAGGALFFSHIRFHNRFRTILNEQYVCGRMKEEERSVVRWQLTLDGDDRPS